MARMASVVWSTLPAHRRLIRHVRPTTTRPMFWRDFPTATAATKAFRQLLNAQPFKTPFESDLLGDLIAERHYFCAPRAIRPSRFRKLPGYGAYTLEGDFNLSIPDRELGWHPVSWTKCLNPPLTDWDRIVRAMRDRSEPVKLSYRNTHPVCERCGIAPSMEVHHESPSFREIALGVRTTVADDHITECLGAWDWFLKEDFSLPDGHAITISFDSIHASATLQALCRICHHGTKKKAAR